MPGRVKAELRILDLFVQKLQASHCVLLCTPTSFLFFLVLYGISDCLNLCSRDRNHLGPLTILFLVICMRNGIKTGIEEGHCGIGWVNNHLRTQELSLRLPHNRNLQGGVGESDNSESYWTVSMVIDILLALND